MTTKLRELLDGLRAELAPRPVPFDLEVAIVQYLAGADVDGIAGPQTKAAAIAWLDGKTAKLGKG